MKRGSLMSASVVALSVALLCVLSGCPKPQGSAQGTAPTPIAEPGTGSQLQGTITISGAWALYPMVVKWGEEFRTVHPQVRLDISAGGAGKGAADALGGLVDIGMISRDIHPDEESKGAWWVPVCKDAVFSIVNARNPVLRQLQVRGIKREALIAIFVDQSLRQWGQVVGSGEGSEVHVYTRSDACGAAETWAKYLGTKQEDLKGTGVYGDPGLVKAVAEDPLGIGYANLNYAYDQQTGKPVSNLVILPLDLNGNAVLDAEENFYGTQEDVLKAIMEDRYPSPPARLLNLMCKGRPTGATAEFIRWILTDGQQMCSQAGYIPLAQDQVQAALQKLQP